MRIRQIKPEFFDSEDAAGLDWRTQITWIGLWCYVDDEGRGKDNPRLIKAKLFPLRDDMTPTVVDRELSNLHHAGRIVRYRAAGEALLAVVNFAKHQYVQKSKPSRLPPPPSTQDPSAGETPKPGDSGTAPVAVPESYGTGNSSSEDHSGSPPPSRVKGSGVRGQGSGVRDNPPASPVPPGDCPLSANGPAVATPPSGGSVRDDVGDGSPESAPASTDQRKRGIRIPDDFAVTSDMASWARENAPDVQWRRETETFIDYWRSSSGTNASKRDWVAAWRNWLRKEQKRLEEQPRPRSPAVHNGQSQTDTTVARLLTGQRLPSPFGQRALPPGDQP